MCEQTDEADAVLALAKSARRTVGFLPDSAFQVRARQGTLLAIRADDAELVAYAPFDLPRDQIKRVHLVVNPAHERRGLARVLIDEIERRLSARRGITLSCRNDYPANDAWQRLGFVPIGECVGRSVDGKLLTRWWKSFGHPDRLSVLDESDLRPLAVLDSCTLVERIAEPPGEIAQQLRSDWIGDHARLAMTDEILIETSRSPDPLSGSVSGSPNSVRPSRVGAHSCPI